MTQLPRDAKSLAAMMDRLEFSDASASAPPVAQQASVMAVRSIRWSADFDSRVKAVARDRGLTVSQLVRDLVEVELAAMEHDQPISRADALRALASLRPVGGAA